MNETEPIVLLALRNLIYTLWELIFLPIFMKYWHLLMSLVVSFAVRLLRFLLFFIAHSSFLVFGPAWVQESFFCSRKYPPRISVSLKDVMAITLDGIVVEIHRSLLLSCLWSSLGAGVLLLLP